LTWKARGFASDRSDVCAFRRQEDFGSAEILSFLEFFRVVSPRQSWTLKRSRGRAASAFGAEQNLRRAANFVELGDARDADDWRVTPGWASSQARAICAGVALPRSAAASSSRKMSRLRSSNTRATTAPRRRRSYRPRSDISSEQSGFQTAKGNDAISSLWQSCCRPPS